MAIENRKNSYINIVIAAIILVIAMIGGFYSGQAFRELERVSKPLSISGVSFQGMKRGEAMHALNMLCDKLSYYPVQLEYEGEVWTIFPKDVSFSIDSKETLKELMNIGTKSFIFFWHRDPEPISPQRLIPKYTLDRDALAAKLEEINEKIRVPARNAFFIIDKYDKVKISSGVSGRSIDIDKTIAKLLEAFLDLDERKIYIEIKKEEPVVYGETLQQMGISELISSYSTKFRLSQENRAYNISLAAQIINGIILAPGEVFSFNKVIGPRDENSLFKDAPQIVGNDMVEGIGGGICQVSTTLYNSVLLANLRILERYKHSVPVGYAPIGTDATVAYDYLDLKFQNTRKEYILITAGVEGEIFIVKIYGKKNPGIEVEVVSSKKEITKTGDTNLEIKEDDTPAYRIIVERIIKRNGIEMMREIISEDIYNYQI